jgi:hypothetical protein
MLNTLVVSALAQTVRLTLPRITPASWHPVAFRELLVTKPVMSEPEPASELARAELALVVPQVQRAYARQPTRSPHRRCR